MSELLAIAVGFFTLVGFAGGWVYLRGFVGAEDVRGRLAAKDDALATERQVRDALEARVAQLESGYTELRDENAQLAGKIEILEKYSAPEAVKRFERQQEVMIEILKAIQQEISK